jgi:DNA repair exonuclease SbcCD nuclease subunit
MRLGDTKTGKLEVMVFGDVHLGHPNTKTPEIIASLYRMLPNTEENRNLDIIFIEGDLFDSLLYMNFEFSDDINLWAIWLIRFCAKNKIALRVLAGTPSHDMGQPEKLFAPIVESFESEIDYKFIGTLHLERHEKTGTTILYLPDEFITPIEEAFPMAQKLIKDHGLEQVDLICMHGGFEYQYPANCGIPSHNSELWQTLVVYWIMIGHVHTSSQVGKIVASGSLERLKHGEESPKGLTRITIGENINVAKFVENKKAKIYKTIECDNETIDDLLDNVKLLIKKYPVGSFFRFAGNKDSGVKTLHSYCASKYPNFTWSVLERDDTTKAQNTVGEIEISFQPIDLTKENLPELIRRELFRQNPSIDDERLSRCMLLLKEAL